MGKFIDNNLIVLLVFFIALCMTTLMISSYLAQKNKQKENK